ncbi:MAG: flavin monoamine oxidase family protein, partial [Bdellovibrionota bacterium]
MRFQILLALALTVTGFPAHAAPPAKVDVVVIGAGLSGLNAAYELKKAGLSYHILEATPHVGGRVRTVHYRFGGEDLYADSGMEEYWESNPAVKVLKELKLPLRDDVALSSMTLDGKMEPLGDESSQQFLTRIFGAEGYQALEKFKTKVTPLYERIHAGHFDNELLALKAPSLAEWVGKQGLPKRVADWIRISLECEIGTEWTKISALDGIAEFHIFLGNGEKSFRVVGGNERFTNAFAKSIGEKNISTNKKVNRIVSKGGDIAVYYLDQATNLESSIHATSVISTVPLFRLSEIQFEPMLSEKKRNAISTQTYGSYFKAHIFLPPTAEHYWNVGVGGSSILPLLSDSELGVIYDGNPDQKGKTRIMSLLITGSHAETFNFMPLDYVRPQLEAALERLFPGIAKEIQGMEFYRYHPRAIAAWPPGRSRFDELSEEIRRPENGVHLSGDFTETSHSDGAFISSHRAVQQIL